MRKNNLLLGLLFLPSLALANLCETGTPLAKQWRDQASWMSDMIAPAPANSDAKFPVFKDNKGQIFLNHFDIKSSYRSDISMRVSGLYDRTKYLKICQENGWDTAHLTYARQNNSKSEFRIPITYLPSLPISATSPYKFQGFATEGIGAHIILGKDSLLEKSASWPSSADSVIADLEKTIKSRLASQVSGGVGNSVVLVLDGMDDVVCDLMSGRIDIEFYHDVSMTNPQVEVKNQIFGDDLQGIYKDLTTAMSLSASPSKEQSAFTAGSVWRKRQMDRQTEISQEAQAYKVISQLLDPTTGRLLALPSEEINCLADSQSEYSKKKSISTVSLRLKTQSIMQAVEN